jgi:hypothetical protein
MAGEIRSSGLKAEAHRSGEVIDMYDSTRDLLIAASALTTNVRAGPTRRPKFVVTALAIGLFFWGLKTLTSGFRRTDDSCMLATE